MSNDTLSTNSTDTDKQYRPVTIETTAEEFASALKRSLKPAKKVSIPVLQQAKIGNGTVTVTDLDITTVVPFAVAGQQGDGDGDGGGGGDGNGEFLVPYHQTLNVLAGETGPLTVKYQPRRRGESQCSVTYRLRDCEYTFGSEELGMFPQTPEFPSADRMSTVINDAEFRTLIDRTLFAVSKEESRYTQNGVLLTAANGKVTLVATDGYRLSMASAVATTPPPMSMTETLVQRDALVYLRAQIKGPVSIAVGDVYQFFVTDDIQMAVRKMPGRFPDYRTVLPHDDDRTIHAEIGSAAKLLPVLTRVAKCADGRSGAVKLEFGRKSLILTASSIDNGSAKAEFLCVADGELRICFNSVYLAEYLKIVGDRPVKVSLRDAQSSVKFSIEDWDWEYVLMPMRG